MVRRDRLPEGHGAGRAATRRSPRRRARGARAGRCVRPRSCARRAVGPRRPPRPAPQRRARAGRAAHRCRGDRHQQRALRHTGAPSVGDRARGGARPAFARRDRRLAPGRTLCAPPIARRTGAAVRALARRGRAHRRHRVGVRVRPQARGTGATRLPGPRRAYRDVVAARARPVRCCGRVPALARPARPSAPTDRPTSWV